VGKDSSLKTWQGDQWKTGGGTTWGWYSYDKALNLLYYGTGNPSTWNPAQRPGDNKWSMTIFARDVDTGQAKWVYQMTPYDEWDFDGINEMILADIDVKGKATKALVHFDRNGFGYTLDRTNGALLVAEKYDPKVNWATHVDMKTGRPVESEGAKKYRAGEPFPMWPSVRGAKNWPHAAFNPNTGLLYANTNHSYSTVRMLELAPFKAGTRYVGVENTYPTVNRGDIVGHIEAIDPLTATSKWRIPVRDYQIASAMLATGGGLLFSGKHTGEFFALDADTGQTLWEFRTSSGVNAMPITWTHKGKQYVTVLSGLGGLYGTRSREALKDVPVGGSVWTFALPDF
jgi:alcohol dehydrogenase (cytochrome c)